MAAGHPHSGHGLYVVGDGIAHRMPAHGKIAAAFVTMLAVVATPREQFWAFGLLGLLMVGAVVVCRLPPLLVARRCVVEVPFVVFAMVLPFVALGSQVEVLGVMVSRDGLLAGWNIVAKGTIGVLVSVLLASTTDARDLVAGLQRLRVPGLLVEIFAFMVRYADVVADQVRRMRVARESRGFTPTRWGRLAVMARTAGALFVRSFERGERVHLAMLSRGYAGRMPDFMTGQVSPADWARVAVLPAAVIGVAASAMLTA